MKIRLAASALVWLAPVLAVVAIAAPAKQPLHAVLFIIDGLSFKALDRIALPHLQSLVARGTYCARSYNVMPAHPKTGDWSTLHRSSIPNPVILAGTVLLRRDQRYVQQSFFPARLTAHAANDVDYSALNVGFNLTFMAGSDDSPVHDDETMHWAIEFLRRARPAFMRVHLQDTGNAGSRSYDETNRSVPWFRDIWAEGSPYRRAAARADEHLGAFMAELQSLGLSDSTVLFVTADHGQSDAGWHPYDDEDGWTMPLVIAGPGVKTGQRLEYSEQTDIVPTLCYLMKVPPPANADGRILAEALIDPPREVPPRRQDLKDLNGVLREGDALIRRFRTDAARLAGKGDRFAVLERDFYGIERILEWRRFASVAELVEHNRRVAGELAKLAGSAEPRL